MFIVYCCTYSHNFPLVYVARQIVQLKDLLPDQGLEDALVTDALADWTPA